MARACEVCGKRSQVGNKIETRGKAKYLGGVGTKITGKTKRSFRPNLCSVKITNAKGGNEYAKVCARCLRGGAVRKAVKQKPFRLPVAAKS
ncbi:MAG: 50S ribosomal protein L28 [Planctomycetota bacterium]|jgi:large subunit ribosomal protein L28